MNCSVVVKEYAELTTIPVENTLNRAHISQSCFEWLLKRQADYSKAGKKFLAVPEHKVIKLDTHVGFLQSPCGTSIEILPKYFRCAPDEEELEQGRKILVKMIAATLGLPYREFDPAQLSLFKFSLPEWIYAQFLLELDKLYKKGLRFHYQKIEEENRFLRGQLHITKQLRQPPGREHLFQIRHELFTPDRPENRLIKLALGIVRNQVCEPANWRLSNELSHLLRPIPESPDYTSDFKAWKDDRLMVDYRSIRPWCELIVRNLNPMAQKGTHTGISLLFPMEKLFECYVANCLKQQLKPSQRLQTQASREYLCFHKTAGQQTTKRMFQLKPDLLLVSQKAHQVMDTKWKLLDSSDQEGKYGISQSDFYQMFAYGQKYMDRQGDMILIYPATDDFSEPLPVFNFDHKLRLWVVPFDLNESKLVKCSLRPEGIEVVA